MENTTEKHPDNNKMAKELNKGANSKEGQSRFRKVKDYYEFVNVSEVGIGDIDPVLAFRQWVDGYAIQQNLNQSQDDEGAKLG